MALVCLANKAITLCFVPHCPMSAPGADISCEALWLVDVRPSDWLTLDDVWSQYRPGDRDKWRTLGPGYHRLWWDPSVGGANVTYFSWYSVYLGHLRYCQALRQIPYPPSPIPNQVNPYLSYLDVFFMCLLIWCCPFDKICFSRVKVIS